MAALELCPRCAATDGWPPERLTMAFDPICGDGTAQAIREAILASAVIRAITNGGDRSSLLSHYETLLTGAIRRHLARCTEFYRTGGSGPWWQTELSSLADGYRWCSLKLANAGEPRYQLRGFELTARKSLSAWL